eukprot:CAMPEP_0175119786 /NCGR_PEP_ID=MMETSP0087-20121206/259_1 /TAXON_ID=136419 /ORGANISM="Unknown Unknown, Strain D1" /LENGTH=388 /DNA_ID=CAMNT_0016401161 /DNA_START=289 /DNA_END=1455 /DNA_ORIENTATION=+
MVPDTDRIVSYSTLNPPFNDPNFLQLAHYAQSHCLFAHIRASDTPAKYNSLANCHPFIFGDLTFMHNGGISNFSQVKRELLTSLSQEAFELIHGTTDSELIGALFIDYLSASSEAWVQSDRGAQAIKLKTAVVETINHIVSTVKTVMREATKPCSLNLVVTNGDVLVATRYRNANAEPPSLYYRWEQRTRSVIVSSEPLSFKQQWELIPRNHILTFDPTTNILTLDPIDLPYQPAKLTHTPVQPNVGLPSPLSKPVDFLFTPVVPCSVHMTGECDCNTDAGTVASPPPLKVSKLPSPSNLSQIEPAEKADSELASHSSVLAELTSLKNQQVGGPTVHIEGSPESSPSSPAEEPNKNNRTLLAVSFTVTTLLSVFTLVQLRYLNQRLAR